MKTRIAVGTLLFGLAVAAFANGCAKRAAKMESSPGQAPVAAEKAAYEGRAVQSVAYQLPDQAALAAAVSARKVITDAYRTVKVKDVVEGFKRATKIVETLGGYVQSSELQKGTLERERRAELVLRLPASNVDRALEEVEQLGEVLVARSEGKDVTEEWVDLDSRIRNFRKEEEVLLDLMGRRAGNLSQVLEVERELARVRGEIEQSEGRLRMLSEQVSLATIHLTLVETGVAVKAIPAGLWALRGTVSHAARAAMVVARAIVGIVVWIGTFAIVWVPVLAIYLGGRYGIKRVRRAAK